MKDATPEIQSETTPMTADKQETCVYKRNPIAIISVIVVLAAIVFGVWQLAHLIGH